MRIGFLTFLIVTQMSFAGVTASSKPAQIERPQGAPTASVPTNEVAVKPQTLRNRAFFGGGLPHSPKQTVQNPSNNLSEEEEAPPLKPLRSPFGNQTIKESSW